MNVTRKQQRILQRAIEQWQQEGVLNSSDGQRLSASLSVRTFDWQRLSRYAFWTAIACVLIALGSLFADAELIAAIINLFSDSAVARIILPTLLAIAFYYWGFRRQRRESQWHYSTEAILFLGVVCTAIALWQLGDRLDDGSGHVAPLILLGCAIYGLIGFFARSGLVWLFFLLALGNWFGAETGYISGWGAYWLGMSFPIRFVLFGGVLLALCYLMQNVLRQRQLFTVSKAMGLTWLFVALWIVAGELDGGFGQRQEKGIAESAIGVAKENRFHRQLAHLVQLGKTLFDLAAGFIGNAFAQCHTANGAVFHRVTHPPVDITVPDVPRVFFWAFFVRIEPGDHCLY